MDETREFVIGHQNRRRDGNVNLSANEEEIINALAVRAHYARLFYDFLCQEGFPPQDSLLLVSRMEV